MDLNDAQKEALDALSGAFDSPDAFASALQEQSQRHYQAVYDQGHKAGFGEVNRKLEQAQAKLEEREQSLESTQSELEQLREETPDAESLRQQWEERELQPLKEQAQTYKERYTQARRNEALQRVKDHLSDEVADPWVAEKLASEAQQRVDVSDDGVRYLRPDGQAPYAASDSQDAAKLMADDLLSEVPEPLRANKRNANGSRYKGNANTGVGSKPKSEYSRSEKAEFFAEKRAAGEDPGEAWSQLPDE